MPVPAVLAWKSASEALMMSNGCLLGLATLYSPLTQCDG